MTQYFKLAWRNLWRNKRRTLITGASVFFGVVLSSFMTSMQEGSYAQMIRTIVTSYSGYIQIYKKGYWDDKILNNSLTYSRDFQAKIQKIPEVNIITPRIESYALASSEELTKGVMVMGVLPNDENAITNLSKKIKSGRYLRNGDNSVIIGSSLARYLKLNINDTLVLLSQGYHGVSAAGKFPVTGIIKHPSPELDRSAVYMDINQCRDFFSAPDKATSAVIMVRSSKQVAAVKEQLEKSLGTDFEIKDWKEINRILLKQIDSDKASGLIIKGLLYLIIAFGIFGTIMMMTLERRKEFAVLIAVGMQRFRLGYVLLAETIMVGLVGCISGIIASFPLTLFYYYHPIEFTGQAAESMLQMGFEPVMSFSLSPTVFLQQAITILVFSLLIGIYPVLVTGNLKINKALRA